MITNSTAAKSTPRVHGRLSEHYTTLADQLHAMRTATGESMRAVGVTSCLPGEGVSTVVTNLAITAATVHFRPVLLVDANFTKPNIHRLFGLSTGPGLAEALTDEADAMSLMHEPTDVYLSVLTAGGPAACSRATGNLEKLVELLEPLKKRFELILIDLPAFSVNGSWSTWSSAIDGVLLVVESERRSHREAQRLKRRLAETKLRPLGVVLNKQRAHVPRWLSRHD